jgi:nucleoside-diphosphate-sugar epimerase
MMRVLVTGPSGFIGTYCLLRLRAVDCEIHAVNRAGAPSSGESHNGIVWHARDLRDPSQAVNLIEAVRPTHLLHGAWIATPRVYRDSPENADWLQASLAMAWAFGRSGGRRFVGIGSSAEYGPSDTPCTEDETPVQPAWIYGKCKAACWLGVEAAAQHYGFEAAWGRLFMAYGPGDAQQRLIPWVLSTLRCRKPLPTTEGSQMRDFIYAPDAADLLIRLLLSSRTGVFNIGTGHGTTIRSVVEHLADWCGGRELVQFGAVTPSPGEPAMLVADMTKVKIQFGWSASTTVQAGLDRLLAEP